MFHYLSATINTLVIITETPWKLILHYIVIKTITTMAFLAYLDSEELFKLIMLAIGLISIWFISIIINEFQTEGRSEFDINILLLTKMEIFNR